MNKLALTSLLILLVLGAASAQAQQADANVAITLERTACFGTCPVYSITILEDGTVSYNGANFVEVTGAQTSEIGPETVQAMVAVFADAGYFDWNEAYTTQNVTDLPTITTSVTRDGETHRIERYAGDSSAPLELPFLEQWIDEMTDSQIWTGVEPDVSLLSNGSDTPVITLQRDPCFGMCPVYSVAVFADGSIVYTGIAHVKEIGVHVIQAEPAVATSIIQRAQGLGYFDWQDSYENHVITDQATVTTSIQTVDQYKRIVRYDGDSNAPIGLEWVETSIEQLVSDLTG